MMLGLCYVRMCVCREKRRKGLWLCILARGFERCRPSRGGEWRVGCVVSLTSRPHTLDLIAFARHLARNNAHGFEPACTLSFQVGLARVSIHNKSLPKVLDYI